MRRQFQQTKETVTDSTMSEELKYNSGVEAEKSSTRDEKRVDTEEVLDVAPQEDDHDVYVILSLCDTASLTAR